MATMHHPHHSEAGWDVAERNCKAETCGQRFKPVHPRQLYCKGTDCPGAPPPVRTRRRSAADSTRNRSERPPAAEARAVAVKGFLADVLMGIHLAPGRATMSIPEAVDEYMDAARAGRIMDAREHAVRICSLVAARYFDEAAVA